MPVPNNKVDQPLPPFTPVLEPATKPTLQKPPKRLKPKSSENFIEQYGNMSSGQLIDTIKQVSRDLEQFQFEWSKAENNARQSPAGQMTGVRLQYGNRYSKEFLPKLQALYAVIYRGSQATHPGPPVSVRNSIDLDSILLQDLPRLKEKAIGEPIP